MLEAGSASRQAGNIIFTKALASHTSLAYQTHSIQRTPPTHNGTCYRKKK
jgi:hypothetical protein